MELEAEPLRVQEHALAQVDENRLADARREHGVPRDERRTDHPRDEVDGHRERQRHPVLLHERWQTPVDAERDESRARDLSSRADHDDNHRERDLAAQRCEQRPEQSKRPTAHLGALGFGEVVALLAFNASDAHRGTSSRSRFSSSSRLEITKR